MSRKQAMDDLKAVFKNFSSKYHPNQAPGLAKDTALDFGKSIKSIDQMAMSMKKAMIMKIVESKVPAAKVEEFVNDLYDVFTGPETAAALTKMLHSTNLSDLPDMIDGKLEKLKDPKTANILALAISQAAKQGVAAELVSTLKAQVNTAPKVNPMLGMMINAQLDSLEGFIDQARDMKQEQVVAVISTTIDALPTRMIVDLVTGGLATMDKAAVQENLNKVRAQLPDSKMIAKEYQQVLVAANDKLTGKKPDAPKHRGFGH